MQVAVKALAYINNVHNHQTDATNLCDQPMRPKKQVNTLGY